jgi:hypothetical protein
MRFTISAWHGWETKPMRVSRRIDEVVALLEAYALGEIDLPEGRVTAALKLLEWAIDDAPPPPDGGDEAPELADDQDVLAFPQKVAA